MASDDQRPTRRHVSHEELELSHPEKVDCFERRYPDAMAAVAENDLEACDPEELDDLASDLRALLRV